MAAERPLTTAPARKAHDAAVPGPPRLYSVGYETHTPESFVGLLERHGVRLLVDVRELASSRRKGFSKTPLAATLDAAGIDYLHLRALGAPRQLRAAYKAGSGDEAFRAGYAAHLDEQWSKLHELEARARARRTAIMCRETDPGDCHRIVITARLAGEGWTIVDL